MHPSLDVIVSVTTRQSGTVRLEGNTCDLRAPRVYSGGVASFPDLRVMVTPSSIPDNGRLRFRIVIVDADS